MRSEIGHGVEFIDVFERSLAFGAFSPTIRGGQPGWVRQAIERGSVSLCGRDRPPTEALHGAMRSLFEW